MCLILGIKIKNGEMQMKIKRKNLIIVYLFTASVFLTGLWRFSQNEKIHVLENDYERLESIAVIVEDIYYNEAENCLSETVFEECFLPLQFGTVTSGFGYRNDPFGAEAKKTLHSGIDIAVDMNSEIFSVFGGTVVSAEYDEIGGNYIRIDHHNGFESYYGHLSQIKVNEGEKVSAGQIIGYSGDSGKVTGPHLHLGLYYNGNPVDPDVYLNITNLLDPSE